MAMNRVSPWICADYRLHCHLRCHLRCCFRSWKHCWSRRKRKLAKSMDCHKITVGLYSFKCFLEYTPWISLYDEFFIVFLRQKAIRHHKIDMWQKSIFLLGSILLHVFLERKTVKKSSWRLFQCKSFYNEKCNKIELNQRFVPCQFCDGVLQLCCYILSMNKKNTEKVLM